MMLILFVSRPLFGTIGLHNCFLRGFPGGTSGKEPAGQCRRHKRLRFSPLGWEDPLKKDIATHSSIFAWRIPWTEEPGGIQSIKLQRVGHKWSGLARTQAGIASCQKFSLVAKFGLSAQMIYSRDSQSNSQTVVHFFFWPNLPHGINNHFECSVSYRHCFTPMSNTTSHKNGCSISIC